MATGPVLFNQPRSLPTIKEAWSSLVPQHIRLKQPCTPEPILVSMGVWCVRVHMHRMM